MIVQFILAVVLTEAVAELLTESRITDRLRRLPGALGYFFGCGYCASVWIGVAAAYLLRLGGVLAGLGAAEPALWGLAVHRASNVLHEAISRFLGRVPWALFLNVRGAVPMDLQIPVEDEPAESAEVTVSVPLAVDGAELGQAAAEHLRDQYPENVADEPDDKDEADGGS